MLPCFMPFSDELRILIIAFHCDPEADGEPWSGWQWVEEAARNYSVTLVTGSAGKPGIERRRTTLDLTALYVEPPRLTPPGLRQLLWEETAWKLIRLRHAEQPFHLVHQITPGTRFPASRLPVPSVWGPLHGGGAVPPGFGPFLGPYRMRETFRRHFQRPWLPLAWRSLERCSVLWVANRTTLTWLPDRFRKKAVVVPPGAARTDVPDAFEPLAGQPLSLLYAGNGEPDHAVPLVFAALKAARLRPGWTFHIPGDGPVLSAWQAEARRLGLSGHVHFPGRLSPVELELYACQSHALVYPALCDGDGMPMLEGMARGIPVVYLDHGSSAGMADRFSGIPIPVRSPEESIRQMARAFERLEHEPEWRRTLGANARARVIQHYSREAKAQQLQQTYEALLAPTRPPAWRETLLR